MLGRLEGEGEGCCRSSKLTRRSIMLFGSGCCCCCGARRNCDSVDEDGAGGIVGGAVAVVGSFVGLPGATEGSLVLSLQSRQFLMTRLTVSLMRTQWYFSAIVAVVLLMPPCCCLCTDLAISYCLCGSATTSLSFSISLSTLPSSSGGASL